MPLEEAAQTLVPSSHASDVRMDMGTRGLVTCSTNLTTREQHVLHSVDWVLEFAVDCCGCNSDALAGDMVLWEDLFHQKLTCRGSSELIVQGEGLEATCSDLESIARRFEEGAIKLHVGPNRSSELPCTSCNARAVA